jgi:hypothetical protein
VEKLNIMCTIPSISRTSHVLALLILILLVPQCGLRAQGAAPINNTSNHRPYVPMSLDWMSTLFINTPPSPDITKWRTGTGQGTFTVTYRGTTSTIMRLQFTLYRNENNIAHGTSAIMTVPPGPVTLTYTTASMVDWTSLSYDKSLQSAVVNEQKFPDGFYRACVDVIDLAGTSLTQSCSNVTIMSPGQIELALPANGDSTTFGNPLFTWMWPGPYFPGKVQSYRVQIVDMAPGQNAVSAFASANTLSMVSFDVPTLSTVYPPSAPMLKDNAKYAWRVQLLDDFGNPIVDPAHPTSSAIWWFKHVSAISTNTTGGGVNGRGSIDGTTSGSLLNPKESTVEGNVKWIFQTPRAPATSGGGSGTTSRSGTAIVAQEIVSLPSIASPGTSTSGSFVDGLREGEYPLNNANVILSIVTPYVGDNGNSIIGRATTDQNGHFVVLFTNPNKSRLRDKVTKVRISVGGGHFDWVDAEFVPSLTRDSSYVIPDMRTYAKTLLARPIVADEFGNVIQGATATIYRAMEKYQSWPSLWFEGTMPMADRVSDTLNGLTVRPVGRVSNGERQEKLFRAAYTGDQYFVRATAPGYTPGVLSFMRSLKSPPFEDGITLWSDTIRLKHVPSVLKGRVVRRDVPNPIVGAQVRLSAYKGSMIIMDLVSKKSREVNTWTTTVVSTNYDGRFEFGGLMPKDTSYQLNVSADGFSSYDESIPVTSSGLTIERDPIMLDAKLQTVNGRVVRETGEPIARASVRWQSGGEPVQTDAQGAFSLKGIRGWDAIHVQKYGYRDKDTSVNVTLDTLLPQSVGTISLREASGKLLVTVVNTSGTPLNAVVRIGDTLATGSSASGSVYFDKLGYATYPLYVSSPTGAWQGGGFVPKTLDVSVTNLQDTVRLTVTLDSGFALIGVVRGNGQTLPMAVVRVEGRDDISTIAKSGGEYQLRGIPRGRQRIAVSKELWNTAFLDTTFGSAPLANHDFNLAVPLIPITSLLGFQINADSVVVKRARNGSADTIVTGTFIGLRANKQFALAGTTRIPFVPTKITMTARGPRPLGDSVQTTCSSFPVLLHGFLPVRAVNPQGLAVKLRTTVDHGSIAGTVVVDPNAFASAKGWNWTPAAQTPLNIRLPRLSTIKDSTVVGVLSDNADVLNPMDTFIVAAADLGAISVYGIRLIPKPGLCKVHPAGMRLQGDISTQQFPAMANTQAWPVSLTVGPAFSMDRCELTISPERSLMLSQWKVRAKSGTIGETGITVNGTLDVIVKRTAALPFDFTGLIIVPDQAYGGTFTLGSTLSKLYGIAPLMVGSGKTFRMARIPGSAEYLLDGQASLNLSSGATGLFSPIVPIRNLQLRSDGDVALVLEPNLKLDMGGIAKVVVSSLSLIGADDPLSAAAGVAPEIDLQGNVSLFGLPDIGLFGTTFRYKANGVMNMDRLNIYYMIPGIAPLRVGLQVENGALTGKGGIAFVEDFTPHVNFRYFKDQGTSKPSFSCDLDQNVPIPLGAVVLTNVNGRVVYAGATGQWTVTLAARLDIPEFFLTIDASTNVTAGNGAPVIAGDATLTAFKLPKVMPDGIGLASLHVLIDCKNKYYSLSLEKSLKAPRFLEGVISSGNLDKSSLNAVVSCKPDDKYWYLSVVSSMTIPGLVTANGGIMMGYNAKISDLPDLTVLSPSMAQRPRFGGVALAVGFTRSFVDANVDIIIAEAHVWAKIMSQAKLWADWTSSSPSYGLFVEGKFDAGASLLILGKEVGKGSVTIKGNIEGGYVGGASSYWYADAQLSATVRGCVAGKCAGKSGSAYINYKSPSKFDAGFKF